MKPRRRNQRGLSPIRPPWKCTRSKLIAALVLLFVISPVSPYSDGKEPPSLLNGGFESATAAELWQVDVPAGQRVSITLDRSGAIDGRQSLLITSDQPASITLRQQVFLPVGTLWRLTGWARITGASNPSPQIGIESPVGEQGFGEPPEAKDEWKQQDVVFRVPSPGRITAALKTLQTQSGAAGFDDIRSEPVEESIGKQSVTVTATHLSKHPIDLKQGGQFIEPLCNLLPSMIAQQVVSPNFEEETPWTREYKREIDQSHRPWNPDGSVQVAIFSYDSDRPFNGKRSLKIDLPIARTRAGVSQGGFYLEAGNTYRLRFHAFLETEGAIC